MRNRKEQPLEKLQQDLEQTQHRIEVEERRMNLAEQQMKIAKRKARNHRLIVKGAEWEKVFPNTEVLTDEEYKWLLRTLYSKDDVRKIVEDAVSHSQFYAQRMVFGEER